MSQTYYALLTAIGEAKLANAAALNTTLKIAKMAVGDGGGVVPTPNRTQTALVNEWYRAGLNTLQVDPSNTSQIIAELVIPEATGGNWIREMGLIDADGNLIAVANTPPSYKPQLAEGSGRTQVLRMVLIVSSTSAVELKIDPSVILATRQYVDSATQQATESTRGTAKIATDADLAAGTDDTRIATSKKLATWWASVMKQASETAFGWTKLATQAQVNAGADDATTVTPKKLRMGFMVSFGTVGCIALPTWLGGFILQWGSTKAANVNWLVATYPIAYPNACYGVWGTIYNDTNGATDSVRRTTSSNPLTQATFAVTNSDGGTSVGWLSIGR